MKPHSNKSPLPDHDPGLEDDTLWTLLDQGSQSKPSPTFLQDTLRRTRLEPIAQPWWKSLLASPLRIATLTAGAAVAALAIVASLPEPPAPSNPVSKVEATAPAEWNDLENALATEVLTDAAEDPTLFSDQEIVALLY